MRVQRLFHFTPITNPTLLSRGSQRRDRKQHVISLCIFCMVNRGLACNGRPIPSVNVVAVKAMYGTEIIEKKLNSEHFLTLSRKTW